MALRSKALHHGRSLSFPSSSNPAISQFDDNLSRLKSSSEAACSSLSSVNIAINDLGKVYASLDDLLLLSQNQHISEKCVDQILDDYIRLLDACSTVKDIVSLTKQGLRELLSSLRRKDANGINAYLASRKKSKKMIQRSLKNLRSNRRCNLEDNHEEMSLLKEAETVAFSLVESLLSYAMGQGTKSSWSIVSKLIHSKKEEETFLNEFDQLESFLQENEMLVSHVKEMNSSIEVLEEGLESLFRQLIKTRVSLLNILNH